MHADHTITLDCERHNSKQEALNVQYSLLDRPERTEPPRPIARRVPKPTVSDFLCQTGQDAATRATRWIPRSSGIGIDLVSSSPSATVG